MKIRSASRGASTVEYGLLAGLVGTVSILAVSASAGWITFGSEVAAEELWMIRNEADNFLVNGDFDDVDGLVERDWGFQAGAYEGWVSNNGLPFELHESGWDGMHSVTGDYWLDMGATPGAMNITQETEGLIPGRIYKITMNAGDRTDRLGNRTLVLWNDVQIGELRADQPRQMQSFEFRVRAGEGSNALTLIEVAEGENDPDGMSIDQIRIWGR